MISDVGGSLCSGLWASNLARVLIFIIAGLEYNTFAEANIKEQKFLEKFRKEKIGNFLAMQVF